MSFGKRRLISRKSWQFMLCKLNSQNELFIVKRFKSYKRIDVKIDNRKSMSLEFGKMAKFADGAVVAQVGDTSVLVAVTSKQESNPSASFLPLTVDYRQKSAAAGRIPTNHLRRELGATDKEILTSRVIDRSLRSLFPSDYFNETQITCNLLSVDGVHDPDVVSINAASAALSASDVPWNGPVGAVRVGGNASQFIVNPTRKQQEQSDINLVIATDGEQNVVMLEGEMKNIKHEAFDKALEVGAVNAAIIAQQIQTATSDMVQKKRTYTPPTCVPMEMIADVKIAGGLRIKEILNNTQHDKVSRDKDLQKVRHSIVNQLTDKYSSNLMLLLHEAVSIVIKQLFRDQIVFDRKRCDGRQMTQVRDISCSVDLYKPLHGSALFQRGQTQVLSTVTFDSLQASMKIDPISVLTGGIKEKNFMLHYEFPAYATNEVKSPGIKNRRELGHGALAEKGLRAIIPNKFPFSIRLTAEVLESNGSSSMASICSGSLALMDAGVKIQEPAAGVAIGLITNSGAKEKYHILTDILGIEDYMGDMDLKIGGTRSGFTAIQMDLKIPGIPVDTVKKAVDQAKPALKHILSIMQTQGIEESRSSIKSCGPVTERMTITPAKRGQFLGIGGINLKKLQSDAGVTITSVDESTYEIFAPNKDAMDEAKEMIAEWMDRKKEPELEFGQIYEAVVTEIRDNGLMVQLHPAMQPVLLPNNQIDIRQVSHPSALGFEVGAKLNVKYFGRDPVTGKIRISRKVLTAVPTGRVSKFFKT